LNEDLVPHCSSEEGVSIPQSGFGAFEHPLLAGRPVRALVVSIPQSGFGAFEPGRRGVVPAVRASFNPSVGIRGV